MRSCWKAGLALRPGPCPGRIDLGLGRATAAPWAASPCAATSWRAFVSQVSRRRRSLSRCSEADAVSTVTLI